MNDRLEAKLAEIIQTESEKVALKEWIDVQKESTQAPYNYRFDHVREVVKLTKHLAARTCADMEVATLAAWLHDYSKPGSSGVPNHGKSSAAAARRLLEDEGIESGVIERVCDAIEKHVGLTLKEPVQPLEAQILWDADKIVKLGVIGLLHFLVNGLKINPGLYLNGMAQKIQEFIPLAEKIVESMNTDEGRAIGRSRLNTLKEISERFNQELDVSKHPGED
ncbi:MAG: HD domain-containing protein [Candidatus Thorarchaeota archaeon]|jgi:HD superfamily phosphodiesterase